MRPITLARRCALLAGLVPALAAPALAADYRLAAGDVVEVSIIGQPDLRQRAPIDIDGNLSAPLVGAVKAAGLSLADLRARIQDLAGRKSIRRRFDDGREVPTVIEPDEITVVVAEYRPVYVNGDVSKPGAVPFKSEMTARQAVALAGGYDVMRFRITNPFIQGADLESDHRAFAAQQARQQTKVARLEAEIGNAGAVAYPGGERSTPIPGSLAAQLRDLESDQFRTRAVDFASDRASLQTLIRFGDTELQSLTEQRAKEEEGLKLDASDFERLQSMYDRGNLPANRITDTRRNLLFSSTRLLQTNVQLERIRRDRELDGRKLQRLENDRRLEITRQLQDARVELAGLTAKLDATREKLLYTSTVRSQLVRGTGGRPDLKVVRRGEDGASRTIRAEEDTVLLPGDTVEVSLLAEIAPDQGRDAGGERGATGTLRPSRP